MSNYQVNPALRKSECAICRARAPLGWAECAKSSWCAWPRHSGRSERPWGKSSCRVPQHLQLLVAAAPDWNWFLIFSSYLPFLESKYLTNSLCVQLPSGSGFMPSFIDLEKWEVEGYSKLFAQTSTSNYRGLESLPAFYLDRYKLHKNPKLGSRKIVNRSACYLFLHPICRSTNLHFEGKSQEAWPRYQVQYSPWSLNTQICSHHFLVKKMLLREYFLHFYTYTYLLRESRLSLLSFPLRILEHLVMEQEKFNPLAPKVFREQYPERTVEVEKLQGLRGVTAPSHRGKPKK